MKVKRYARFTKFFQRVFRKPAIILVTLWAKMAYNQGVASAEQRHAQERVTIYLAADSFKPDRLVTYSKRQFKAEKAIYGMAARLLTMNTLRSGCYYHTEDAWGENGMSAEEMEIRKKAFIKERLHLAGLI